jgi:N-methylhydantoinase A/oxoprolinase/acetone carboxylase beta subunit
MEGLEHSGRRWVMADNSRFIIGVDTGGTFTDVVVMSESGEIWTAKAPTTPDDFSRGVMDALEEAAKLVGIERGEILRRTGLFKHGSIVATNALITRSGVKVGFITTKGFEDTTEIMRAIGREPSRDWTSYVEFRRKSATGLAGGTKKDPFFYRQVSQCDAAFD